MSSRHRLLHIVCAVALSAFLAACDGGGGPNPTSPASSTPGVPTTGSPTTGSGTVTITPPTSQATSSVKTPTLPPCDFPKEIATPTWFPEDLPMPDGTYASQDLGKTSGYFRALFVVRLSLRKLAKFVLSEWPKAGWILGRGDAEPGEIEDQFSKAPAVGAFKAQSVFCSPGYQLMIVIYVPDRSKISVTPTVSPQGSPLAPSTSPTS